MGVTDSENIKAIGELVNADYIVVGKITMLGNKNVLTVQMINVVSGNIESGSDINFANIGDTYRHIDNIVASMVGLENISTTTTLNNPTTLNTIISNITSIAMYEGREGIGLIKALISKNINAIDDNGYTSLILASSFGYTELVKELIAAGANIDAKSYEGISALEVAILREHKWVEKVLRDAGATGVFIGETGPGGGLIFFVDGGKYLESSKNLGSAKWKNAFTLAENYRGGGYDDWYLPNIEELNYIYENLRVPGHIEDDGWFWSSSEVNSYSDAWLHGDQSYGSKPYNDDVRVVRAFY